MTLRSTLRTSDMTLRLTLPDWSPDGPQMPSDPDILDLRYPMVQNRPYYGFY